MQVHVDKKNGVLGLNFLITELSGRPDAAGSFKRRYGPIQGVELIFLGSGAEVTLTIKMDPSEELDLPLRIVRGGPVEGLRVLWSFAHMTGATFVTKQIALPEGQTIEVIHLVQFFLSQAEPGIWFPKCRESFKDYRYRHDWLADIQRGLQGAIREIPLGIPCPDGLFCFFSDITQEGVPQKEEEYNYFLTHRAFEQPTAEDVNSAIRLLLWRCRDAEIHKDTPNGKNGYYGLVDWISSASDEMIKELGMWCADIQELNIGTRDS